MRIHVKDVPDLSIPKTATLHSSGYDVVALEEPKIVGTKYNDGEYWKSIDYIEYKTGLFTAPQSDQYGHMYHTFVFPRSSVRKYNLTLANSIGLIDNDYRGEIILCFKYIFQPEDMFVTENEKHNTLVGMVNMDKIYKKGDKIGQLVSGVSNPMEWVVVADLSTTIRGTGGFGSTTITERKIEAPKEAISLIDKWKEVGAAEVPMPQKYESIAKEREKSI